MRGALGAFHPYCVVAGWVRAKNKIDAIGAIGAIEATLRCATMR